MSPPTRRAVRQDGGNRGNGGVLVGFGDGGGGGGAGRGRRRGGFRSGGGCRRGGQAPRRGLRGGRGAFCAWVATGAAKPMQRGYRQRRGEAGRKYVYSFIVQELRLEWGGAACQRASLSFSPVRMRTAESRL